MQGINRSVLLAGVVSLAIVSVVFPFLDPAEAGQSGEKIEKAAKSEIHHFASIDDLKKAVKDHDYLFVILSAPEKGDGSIQKAALAAAKKAEADEVVVCVAELSRDCEEFTEYVKKSGVEKFPSVLAIKKDGTVSAVQDKITEKQLVKAYLDLASAESNTCPFAKKHSNCDPTACGFKK